MTSIENTTDLSPWEVSFSKTLSSEWDFDDDSSESESPLDPSIDSDEDEESTDYSRFNISEDDLLMKSFQEESVKHRQLFDKAMSINRDYIAPTIASSALLCARVIVLAEDMKAKAPVDFRLSREPIGDVEVRQSEFEASATVKVAPLEAAKSVVVEVPATKVVGQDATTVKEADEEDIKPKGLTNLLASVKVGVIPIDKRTMKVLSPAENSVECTKESSPTSVVGPPAEAVENHNFVTRGRQAPQREVWDPRRFVSYRDPVMRAKQWKERYDSPVVDGVKLTPHTGGQIFVSQVYEGDDPPPNNDPGKERWIQARDASIFIYDGSMTEQYYDFDGDGIEWEIYPDKDNPYRTDKYFCIRRSDSSRVVPTDNR